MAAVVLMLTAILALPQGPPPLAETPPRTAPASRALVLLEPPEGSLPPELALALPGLLAAALESGTGFEIVDAPDAASGELELDISGDGPWRLRGRIQPLGGTRSVPRVTSSKVSFGSGVDLGRAVDELAIDLDARWRERLPGPPEWPRPVPVRQGLSQDMTAMRAYATAIGSLGDDPPDAARALALLDEALQADPGFIMAAAERIVFALAAGDAAKAAEVAAAARGAAGKGSSPLASAVWPALEKIVAGQPSDALGLAESLHGGAPHLTWGHILKGIALGGLGRHAEAKEAWKTAAAAHPRDPRLQAGLGVALMATGGMADAATSLERARKGWPGNPRLYALHAEAQVRLRDTGGARRTLTEMKSHAEADGLLPESDLTNPDLLLGSVDLLEGRFADALKQFESALDRLMKSGAPLALTATLHETVIELRRDLIAGRDPVARDRLVEDAMAAIDRYEAALPPAEREAAPWIMLRLRGLIRVREGNTIEGWKMIEQIRSLSERPGYSDYYEAYLAAATMLKEGDTEGAVAQFERAAKSRGTIVELMDLGQLQLALRRYEDARRHLLEIESRLSRYDPAPGSEATELVLANPHLAALVPLYHYARARLGYETGDAAESRRHFNRMLKYFHEPDEQFAPLVREAYGRGATPE